MRKFKMNLKTTSFGHFRTVSIFVWYFLVVMVCIFEHCVVNLINLGMICSPFQTPINMLNASTFVNILLFLELVTHTYMFSIRICIMIDSTFFHGLVKKSTSACPSVTIQVIYSHTRIFRSLLQNKLYYRLSLLMTSSHI